MTAWVGLFDIGEVRPGETVWISAASGAVGSLAGQLAKLAGCRVVGSAGGPEKCRYVVEELGFDACVDHRAGDLEGQLQEVLPPGLDVYFDNVGGSHLRAALDLANPFARFVECGQISAYNGVVEPVDNLFLIVGKKLTVRGFIVWDSAHRKPLFQHHVAGLLREGRIRYDETVVEGIEHQFDALLALLRGGPSSASSSWTSARPEPVRSEAAAVEVPTARPAVSGALLAQGPSAGVGLRAASARSAVDRPPAQPASTFASSPVAHSRRHGAPAEARPQGSDAPAQPDALRDGSTVHAHLRVRRRLRRQAGEAGRGGRWSLAVSSSTIADASTRALPAPARDQHACWSTVTCRAAVATPPCVL